MSTIVMAVTRSVSIPPSSRRGTGAWFGLKTSRPAHGHALFEVLHRRIERFATAFAWNQAIGGRVVDAEGDGAMHGQGLDPALQRAERHGWDADKPMALSVSLSVHRPTNPLGRRLGRLYTAAVRPPECKAQLAPCASEAGAHNTLIYRGYVRVITAIVVKIRTTRKSQSSIVPTYTNPYGGPPWPSRP